MKIKKEKNIKIKGNLDILVHKNKNKYKGKTLKWDEVLIHGDPKGLRSFANLIPEIADLNQEKIDNKILPVGAREHYHIFSDFELSKSSVNLIIGRLDAKGTGEFYDSYVSKKSKK